MEFSTIYKLLLRKIWILIIVPIIAAAAAFIFSLNAEKKYRSSTLLATGFTTNETIQIKDERVDLWGAGVKFDNMIERMNSELVLALLTYKLLLHDLKEEEPFRSLTGEVNPLLYKSQGEIDTIINVIEDKYQRMDILSSYDPRENDIIELGEGFGYAGWMLKRNLSIYRARSTDFVEVTFISEDPFLSAFVVNTLSNEYIRYDSYLKSGISKESTKFFSDLVEEKKKILDEKTKFLDQFKAVNNPYGEEFSELKSSQILDYEILRQQKLDEIGSKSLALTDVEDQIRALEGEGSSAPSQTNITILQIRSKINELNQIYVSGGSSDVPLQRNIESLRNQLQIEMNKLSSNSSGLSSRLTKSELVTRKRQLELELDILRTNLNSLNQTIDNLKYSVSGMASKKSTIESINRDVENASEEYLQALDKLNSEKNKSLLSTSPISIYQKGQPNGSPEPSKRILIIGLAFMASFSMCVFVIILLEFADQRIKNVSRFTSYTGLRLIGTINVISVTNLNLKSLYETKNEDRSMERFKHFLRKIRFEIQNSAAQVLMVTSTKRGEGKTFVILSLAYSLSLLNKKSLIIDTNFRNNSLTKLLIAKPNLQKMLQQNGEVKLLKKPGENTSSESGNIISSTSDKNIDIIGSNYGLESPSEILAGKDFLSMMDQLRERYDYIFLEGASLNEFSDSKELMTFVDKVIPVFSASSSIGTTDKDSIKYLDGLNGKLLGGILNRVENFELS